MSIAPRVVRCAVVGTGAISQVAHLPILSRMRGVALTGLFDSDRAKAQTLAERLGVQRARDASEGLGEAAESPDSKSAVAPPTSPGSKER